VCVCVVDRGNRFVYLEEIKVVGAFGNILVYITDDVVEVTSGTRTMFGESRIVAQFFKLDRFFQIRYERRRDRAEIKAAGLDHSYVAEGVT